MNNVPNITNPQQLSQCLLNLLANDNATRKKTEVILKKFCLNPQCLMGFVHQIQNSKNSSCRQMAGVLMRVKIKKLWKEVDQTKRENIKSGLLQCLVNEKEYAVRRATIFCVGEIAVFEIPVKKWNNLPGILMKMVQSDNMLYKENGYSLFSVLLEKVRRDVLKGNVGNMVNVFVGGLKNPNPRIIASSLEGTIYLIKCIAENPEIDQTVQVIPVVISLINRLVNSGSDLLFSCFSILDELAALRSTQSTLVNVLPNLVKFMVKISNAENVPWEVRDRAILFIGWVSEYNTHVYTRKNPGLIDMVLQLIFKLSVTKEPPDCDDEDMTPFKAGVTLCDQICNQLPSKMVFDKIYSVVRQMYSQNNYLSKKAAVAILGVVVEGCKDKVKRNLDKIVELLLNGLTNNHQEVRRAAAMATINFSIYAQPDFTRYFDKFLPTLTRAMTNEAERGSRVILRKMILALDRFAVKLRKDQVNPFAIPIMNKLFDLLPKTDMECQIQILSCIGALAEALAENFKPFFDKTMSFLKIILSQVREENIVLRGRSVECLGLVARSMGKESFAPYLDQFMRQIIGSIQNDTSTSELNEYYFNFLNNIASCYFKDERLYNYAKSLVETVLVVLENTDGRLVKVDQQTNFLEDERCLLEKGEEELDMSEWNISIEKTSIDEKVAALDCLGQIAESTGEKFQPYFNLVIKTLTAFHDYYEPVKRKVIITLQRIYVSVCPRGFSKNFNEIPQGVRQNVQKMFDPLMEMYSKKLLEEEDRESVAFVCDAISYICIEIGFVAISTRFQDICDGIVDLLHKDTECFEPDESFSFKENLENKFLDHDETLFDSLLHLVDQVARVAKMNFEPTLKRLFNILLVYMTHEADEDRVQVIGTFSELTEAFGPQIAPYAKHFVPLVLKESQQTNNMSLCRNCYYCLGTLVNTIPDAMQNALPNILKLLCNCLANPNKFDDAVVDNACGAVCRIILKKRVFLEKLIPLVMQNLPLKEDMEEVSVVLECVMILLKEGNPIIAKFMKRVFEMFAAFLPNNAVEDNDKSNMVKCVKWLKSKYSGQVDAIVASLKNNEKAIILKCFTM